MKKTLLLLCTAALLAPAQAFSQNTTFDFEANTSGYGTKQLTQTVSGKVLLVRTTSANIYRATDNAIAPIAGTQNLLLSNGTPAETSVTISLQDGGTFSLKTIMVRDELYTAASGTITTSSGKTANFATTSDGSPVTVSTAGFAAPADFNNISSFTITSTAGFVFSIDNIVLEINTTLPVTLTSFTARAQTGGIHLQWQTQAERDSQSFALYRSGDHTPPTKVHQQPASGNAPTASHYSFLDRQPINGNNYYTLVQTDSDGRQHDLGTTTANATIAPTPKAYPNPAGQQTTISFPAGTYHSLSLSDLSGKRLQQHQIGPDQAQLEVNLKDHPKGTYLIRLQGSTGTQLIKLIRH